MKIKLKKIDKIIILVMLFFLTLNMTFASRGLNVNLVNQNPEMVAPGNFVTLNIKVSNLGSSDIENAEIELIENDHFKINDKSKLSKYLGIIPKYSGLDGSSSYTISKFKVYVDPKTPTGLNEIEFYLKTNNGKYKYTFEIDVEETNPKIEISDLNIDTIKAGDFKELSFFVENKNSINLKNIILSLDLSSVKDNLLTTLNGTNQIIIPILNSFSKKKISFNILADPNAEAKPYLLPIKIDYEDYLGNVHSQEVVTSVRVFSKPSVSFKLDSQDSFKLGKQKLIFAIANSGTSVVKGLEVEILSSDNYEVLDGGYNYVGNLNPDDFQTIQSVVFIKNNEENIRIKLKYLDSYNNKIVKEILVPIKIYSETKLTDLGLMESNLLSGKLIIFLIFIFSFISFILGRKIGYKKGKFKKMKN